MEKESSKPLIVQSDKTLLLEVEGPNTEDARDEISKFAELEKSLEYIHTFRITPLSLWNAAASGLTAQEAIAILKKYSKYPIPINIEFEINDYILRYGTLQLLKDGEALVLESEDQTLITEIWRNRKVSVLPQIRSLLNPKKGVLLNSFSLNWAIPLRTWPVILKANIFQYPFLTQPDPVIHSV
jgi:DNA excision repair protein ERCC-3